MPPVVTSGALVIPKGLLHKLMPHTYDSPFGQGDRQAMEFAAMNAVMQIEKTMGYQPKDVKYYESLVKNQDKIQNALRSLVHAKLLSADTPGVKKAPHMTKARNELAKYGAVPEMIPDIPDFAEDLLLARMTGNDIDAVDLYLAKLDEMNAQDRTLNADGCKTI